MENVTQENLSLTGRDQERFLSLLFCDSFSCSSALHLGDLNFNIITLYKERHKK